MLLVTVALFALFLVFVFIVPMFKAWKYKDFNRSMWNFRN